MYVLILISPVEAAAFERPPWKRRLWLLLLLLLLPPPPCSVGGWQLQSAGRDATVRALPTTAVCVCVCVWAVGEALLWLLLLLLLLPLAATATLRRSRRRGWGEGCHNDVAAIPHPTAIYMDTSMIM
jgi:hypothetical protein